MCSKEVKLFLTFLLMHFIDFEQKLILPITIRFDLTQSLSNHLAQILTFIGMTPYLQLWAK